MSKTTFSNRNIELQTLTCVWITSSCLCKIAKFSELEIAIMGAAELIEFTGVSYSPSELIKMEMYILEVLGWKLTGQSIYDILEYAIDKGALEDIPFSSEEPEVFLARKQNSAIKYRTPNVNYDNSISYENPFEGFFVLTLRRRNCTLYKRFLYGFSI